MSQRSGHGRVDDTLGRGDGDELPGFLGSRVELAPLPYLGGSHDGKTLAPGPAPWTSKRMALAAQTQDAGHTSAARSAARHEGDASQRSAGGRGSGAREADDGSDAPLVEDGPVSGPPPRFTVSGKGPMLAQVGVADDTPRSRGGGVAAGSLRQGGAVRQHLPSKKEMMTIRTRVRLFEVLDGTATVDDGAGAFLMKALRHLAEVKLMVIAMALSSIPMIWSHQWMHATYLEDLQVRCASVSRRGARVGFAARGACVVWLALASRVGATGCHLPTPATRERHDDRAARNARARWNGKALRFAEAPGPKHRLVCLMSVHAVCSRTTVQGGAPSVLGLDACVHVFWQH